MIAQVGGGFLHLQCHRVHAPDRGRQFLLLQLKTRGLGTLQRVRGAARGDRGVQLTLLANLRGARLAVNLLRGGRQAELDGREIALRGHKLEVTLLADGDRGHPGTPRRQVVSAHVGRLLDHRHRSGHKRGDVEEDGHQVVAGVLRDERLADVRLRVAPVLLVEDPHRGAEGQAPAPVVHHLGAVLGAHDHRALELRDVDGDGHRCRLRAGVDDLGAEARLGLVGVDLLAEDHIEHVEGVDRLPDHAAE